MFIIVSQNALNCCNNYFLYRGWKNIVRSVKKTFLCLLWKLAPHKGGNSCTDSVRSSRNNQELARIIEVYRVMEVAGQLCRGFQVEEKHQKSIKW